MGIRTQLITFIENNKIFRKKYRDDFLLFLVNPYYQFSTVILNAFPESRELALKNGI